MIAFSKIKPGMILYDVRKAKGFAGKLRREIDACKAVNQY